MPVSPSNSVWTAARIATLKDCIGKRMTGAAAAELMGLTPGQVSGKADRMGWHFKRKPGRKPKLRQALNLFNVYSYRTTKPTLPTLPIEPTPPPEFLGLTFQQLEKCQCKYPHGDKPFSFCGQPQRDDSSYCEFHHRLCYHKPDPGRRINVYRTF